jgi:hypothetical protein
MKKLRQILIALFVHFLRSVSVFNYRRRIVQYIVRHHDKKALSDRTITGTPVNERLRRLGYTKRDVPWNVFCFLAGGKHDKWFAHLPGVRLPTSVLRNINGFFYNQSYEPIDPRAAARLLEEGRYVIKPSLDSGGGKNVHLLEVTNVPQAASPVIHSTLAGMDQATSFAALASHYERDYVVQRWIRQHEYFARLCPTSVNTVRLMTYRSVVDDSVHVLHRIMKIGRQGNVVDNQSAGSLVVGVAPDGTVTDWAWDEYGVRYAEFNGISIREIPRNPFVPAVDRAATAIADQVYYSRLLGMDFAVDDTGTPVFIEMNHNHNGMMWFQYTNGPLFREYTNEVLDYCLRQDRRHYVYY